MSTSFSFMKIFLDTADVSFISSAYETGLLDGVTTNPSLILKSGRQLLEVITEISTTFPELQSISAEVVADTAEEMLSQAQKYYSIAPAVTIKVPCTVEGLKACKFLTDVGSSASFSTPLLRIESAFLCFFHSSNVSAFSLPVTLLSDRST
jgi:transaldolase